LAISYVLLGREAEGRPLMDEFLRLRPDLTISGFDVHYPRRHPAAMAQRDRIADALRRLGVPD
jgi:hypothetical protein